MDYSVKYSELDPSSSSLISTLMTPTVNISVNNTDDDGSAAVALPLQRVHHVQLLLPVF
jgi:hypothetical protein